MDRRFLQQVTATAALTSATVNGRSVPLGGQQGDTVIFPSSRERHFEIVGQL
jgi:hypothetical protein